MAMKVRSQSIVGKLRGGLGRLLPGKRSATMNFPTFGSELQRDAIESGDYVRYASLALAIRRVESCGVRGALAEVGVYKGTTSRFILRCAPLRTLYLFDTFEGFPIEDREPQNFGDGRFRDTSEEHVRLALGNALNVQIRKGRFPATTAGLEAERFALVLLDLDVFNPTLAGLEFFYPRISRGGYVFVHDYNSPESNSACSRAVNRFLEGRPELPVELPDTWGSVVFRKL
jgi:O-methyltransferase